MLHFLHRYRLLDQVHQDPRTNDGQLLCSSASAALTVASSAAETTRTAGTFAVLTARDAGRAVLLRQHNVFASAFSWDSKRTAAFGAARATRSGGCATWASATRATATRSAAGNWYHEGHHTL